MDRAADDLVVAGNDPATRCWPPPWQPACAAAAPAWWWPGTRRGATARRRLPAPPRCWRRLPVPDSSPCRATWPSGWPLHAVDPAIRWTWPPLADELDHRRLRNAARGCSTNAAKALAQRLSGGGGD